MPELRGTTWWNRLRRWLRGVLERVQCRECGRQAASDVEATQQRWCRTGLGGEVRWVCEKCRFPRAVKRHGV